MYHFITSADFRIISSDLRPYATWEDESIIEHLLTTTMNEGRSQRRARARLHVGYDWLPRVFAKIGGAEQFEPEATLRHSLSRSGV